MSLIFKKILYFYFSFPMRSKRFIYCVLFAVPVFIPLIIVFIYTFLLSKVSVFNALVVDERLSLSNLRQFQGLHAELTQYETHQNLLQTALMNAKLHFSDIFHFNKVIDGMAKESDVMIHHYIKLPNVRVSDALIQSSVKLTGCARYRNFARFLNDLAMYKQSILLEHIAIEQINGGSVPQSCINQDVFSFVMTLSAYQYIDANKEPISAIR